jgi:hypothetical protein
VRNILDGASQNWQRFGHFDPFPPTRHIRVVMRQRGSTSIKSGQSAAPDALIALVRLLARQAAREFVVQAPALPDSQKHPQPGDRKWRTPRNICALATSRVCQEPQ